MKTYPFDLRRALLGEPLVTADGQPVSDFQRHPVSDVGVDFVATVGEGRRRVAYRADGTPLQTDARWGPPRLEMLTAAPKEPPKDQITPEERAVLDLSAQLWNALLELPGTHPQEIAEHVADVHNIQNRVMARVARRCNPDYFVNSED